MKPQSSDPPTALSTCRYCGSGIAYWEFYQFWSHYPGGLPDTEPMHIARPNVEAAKELDDLTRFDQELNRLS